MKKVPALLFCFAALGVIGRAVTQDETAQHKQRMDQAEDLKYDFQDGFDAKSSKKVEEAAIKLVSISQAEVEYWKKTQLTEIVDVAGQSLSMSRTLSEKARKGDLTAAKEDYSQLLHVCASCHDLHPEKRVRPEP